MRYDFDHKTASAAAKRLRAHLAREGVDLKHAAASECVARVLNFESANAMRAGLPRNADAPAQADANPFAGVDVRAFLDALDTVLEQAEYAVNERESGVEDGLYDPADNPTDQISEQLARVYDVRTLLVQRIAPPEATRPLNDPNAVWNELIRLRIDHGAAGVAPARVRFERDEDGFTRMADDGAAKIAGTSDPATAGRVRARLRAMAAGDLSNAPARLIAPLEISDDDFLLIVAPEAHADGRRAAEALNRLLAPHGIEIDAGPEGFALKLAPRFRTDAEAAAWLLARAAETDGGAVRALGFLLAHARDDARALFSQALRAHGRDVRGGLRVDPDDPDARAHRLFRTWVDRARMHPSRAGGVCFFQLRPARPAAAAGDEPVRELLCGGIGSRERLSDALVARIAEIARNPEAWPIGFAPTRVDQDGNALSVRFD